GVRMMTVHGAKGLEFPVVILADLTCNETPREPRRWADADRGLCVQQLAGCTPPELHEHAAEEMAREGEEATRVLYVAATRARDLLVVPALGDGRYDGWLQALTPVLYPSPDRVHAPETRQPPGCPAFGEAPSLGVVTVTERAAAAAALAGEVAVESVGTAGPRPHGKRFGTLVHAVLAAVELDADRAGVADAAALHGRLLGATAEEVEAAVDTAVRALAHPLLRRA